MPGRRRVGPRAGAERAVRPSLGQGLQQHPGHRFRGGGVLAGDQATVAAGVGGEVVRPGVVTAGGRLRPDRKSTRLNSSHVRISYAVFCLKKKKNKQKQKK